MPLALDPSVPLDNPYSLSAEAEAALAEAAESCSLRPSSAEVRQHKMVDALVRSDSDSSVGEVVGEVGGLGEASAGVTGRGEDRPPHHG